MKDGNLPRIFLAVLGIAALACGIIAPFGAEVGKAAVAGKLMYTSVDVMKWTKDTIRNQPTDSQITSIVTAIARDIRPQYIAISIPMDSTADFGAQTPSPRTVEAFTQKWSDAIHAAGMKVLWRGTWSGIEGIYNFPRKTGSNRFPAGTAGSAPTDGGGTWLGKTYKYIADHPAFFTDGDIWAPLPERTEGVFSDATSFLPATGAGLQANYASFMNDLKAVSDSAFAKIGKHLVTGLTSQNYSEFGSTWLPRSIADTAGMLTIDHYGITHTPQEMEADIRKINSYYGKPVFLQEWGDYWHPDMPADQRVAYLSSMYAVWQRLVEENILIGYNYWGAWPGNMEGILEDAGGGNYRANSRGMQLAAFFAAVGPTATQPATTPSPAPVPAPAPTPAPDTIAPSIPSGLQAIPVSTTQVSLSWQASVDNVGVTGYRIFQNDVQIGTSAAASYQVSNLAPSTAYSYTVKALDAAGNTSVASASVSIQTPAEPVLVPTPVPAPAPVPAPQPAPALTCDQVPADKFSGCYYDNADLSKLVLVRIDPKVDFVWNDGSPDPKIAPDTFSVRWRGSFTFTSGTYRFSVSADDGFRLSLDGTLILDKWIDQHENTLTVDRALSGGKHEIQLEYYENAGGAVAKFYWEKLPRPLTGQSAGQPKQDVTTSPKFDLPKAKADRETQVLSVTSPPAVSGTAYVTEPTTQPSESTLTAANSVLPYNVREGEVVKFPRSSTVYLIRKDGLHPFYTGQDLLRYTSLTGFALKQLSGDASVYTLDHPVVSETVSAQALLFPSSSLINDQGTIFMIREGRKLPFTNFESFRALGYKLDQVLPGDTSGYGLGNYQVSSVRDGHPWGSWVSSGKTIYYTHPTGLIGVPSYDIFLQNGGQQRFITPVTFEDLQILASLPPPLPLSYDDSRIYR